MSKNATFLHGLNLVAGGEPSKTRGWIEEYENAEAAWNSLKDDAIDLDAEVERLMKLGIALLAKDDRAYPPLLTEIHEAPELLYIKGSAELLSAEWLIGMVGSRKPTDYGVAAATKLASDLAGAGAVIISGLAFGIDTASHIGALRAGKTIGVIGSGLDRDSFYPPVNWGISEKITASGGAVISEYPPGTASYPSHFPERNRIIAGLSRGVIVVEAQEKSGALITARLALEENRDVFAVPGSIFSATSKGPNTLIRDGAVPVTSSEDVLAFYGKTPHEKTAVVVEGEEGTVLTLLARECTIEELRRASGLEIGPVQAILSALELKGLVHETEPGTYAKTA